MKGTSIPANTSKMLSSIDDKYIYCLVGNSIHIFDTIENKTIKRLHGLRNSNMIISCDGRYLGCIHPKGRAVEVCVYDIRDDHREVLRDSIQGEFSTIAPCFTYDNKYILLCNGVMQNNVWCVDLLCGAHDCIYKCGENYTISNIDSGKYGILVSICNGTSFAPLGYHVYFSSATSIPEIIDFEMENVSQSFIGDIHGGMVFETNWLDGSKAVVAYRARSWKTKFQIVDFSNNHTITPSEDYSIPYSMLQGIVLSRNKEYAACVVAKYDNVSGKVENRAYVFRTCDGKEYFSQGKNYLWDIRFLNKNAGLLISSSIPEIEEMVFE